MSTCKLEAARYCFNNKQKTLEYIIGIKYNAYICNKILKNTAMYFIFKYMHLTKHNHKMLRIRHFSGFVMIIVLFFIVHRIF